MNSPERATSMRQFQRRFRTEASCRKRLFGLRWPAGFTCPVCRHRQCYELPKRNLYQCKACRHQVSVTAGTVMHRTRTPLRVWFWAIYLMSNDKRGLSALQLSKKLEVSYYVAWTMLHKIRRAMRERDLQYELKGIIKMESAILGGQPGGDKRGRGWATSTVIVEASTNQGSVKFTRMRVSEDHNRRRSRENARARNFKSLEDLPRHGSKEPITVRDDARASRTEDELFRGWLHIIVSNLKSFLLGTFHGIGKKHLQKYLDEFCYRFNRRNMEQESFDRLVIACANSKGVSYSELTI